MMKKLKIVGVLAIVGATVTSVVVPLMKHHKHRDRQDGSPWRVRSLPLPDSLTTRVRNVLTYDHL
jgi:hypothetical protein